MATSNANVFRTESGDPDGMTSVGTITANVESIDLDGSKESASDCDLASDVSDYETRGYDLGRLSCLPPEVMQCIMGHLDARFVLTCLSLVCKTLYHLVKDKTTWKLRVTKLSEKAYPIFTDDTLDWPLACIQREEFNNIWTNPDHNDHFNLTGAHYAAIDCVHLTEGGRFCYSGARDRSIQMWDLAKLDMENLDESINESKVSGVVAHKGWVWHISSNGNKLCSSSWDCYMKIWDVGSAELKETDKLKGNSAFLCSVFNDDILIAGSYDKRIYAYDPRDSWRSTTKWHIHSGPVLCLASDDKYMISGSEDRFIKVFDRRADKVLIEKRCKSFPMSISYGYNQLWTGHKDGTLTVTQTNSGLFNIVKTFDPGHSGKLTGVVHNLGGLCTCATDKKIKIHAPTNPIDTIHTLSEHAADVTAISMQNNVLASSGGDTSIKIWRPKTWSA